MNFKDKNGKTIKRFDTVQVPEPIESDIHNFEFTGIVDDFEEGYAVVSDGEGDTFAIEPERLIVE